MSMLYRGPAIDASYQVSVHLAKGFQRRRLKCEKLTGDERQVMAKWAKNVKIVFAGGVCNLTTTVRYEGGIEISYHRSDDKIQCLIGEYDSM
jgi:hypothetical protein